MPPPLLVDVLSRDTGADAATTEDPRAAECEAAPRRVVPPDREVARTLWREAVDAAVEGARAWAGGSGGASAGGKNEAKADSG